MVRAKAPESTGAGSTMMGPSQNGRVMALCEPDVIFIKGDVPRCLHELIPTDRAVSGFAESRAADATFTAVRRGYGCWP